MRTRGGIAIFRHTRVFGAGWRRVLIFRRRIPVALRSPRPLSAMTRTAAALARAPHLRASTALAALALLSACGLFGGSGHHTGTIAPGAALMIPVEGIQPEQLRDTYDDARDGGRVHHAIDIMAPRGSPVLAAADGRVLKLRSGATGGITIYQVGRDGRTLYYYAHLQRYAGGIREGKEVRQGELIAYVGDTGNAGRGNYHLHFSVGHLTNPARWWESQNVDPYPLLAGDAARRHPQRAEARD